MLAYFSRQWADVPLVVIDCETTGIRPGIDRAVQVGFARFERGLWVAGGTNLVNPGIPIPAEATAIHGITNEMVRGAPTIDEVFALEATRALLADAQPAAYNAPFDRHFVPPFGEDWTWPWIDVLSLVRAVDRFVRGKGRHKLEAACQRHHIELPKAHDAGADAKAAGELFYKIAPFAFTERRLNTLGEVLSWQREEEAREWFRFNSWRASNPQPAQQGA